MRLLFFAIPFIFISCSNAYKQKNGHKLFIHTGEYQDVEIPLSKDYNFVESTVWLMCPPDYISYTDTLHDHRIQISPTTKSTFLNNENYWLNNEEGFIEGMDRIHDLMKNLKSFYVSLHNYIGQDSASSTHLIYYPYWRIDSSRIFKYVEFTKSVYNSNGWCIVSVRKPYKELNIPLDFKWADSLSNMKIVIKNPK